LIVARYSPDAATRRGVGPASRDRRRFLGAGSFWIFKGNDSCGYVAIRSITETSWSAVYRVRTIRSNVWQCVHGLIDAFCASVPGKLASHSHSRAETEIASFLQLQIGGRRLVIDDVHGASALQVVSHGADAQGHTDPAPACSSERISTLLVGHDGRRDRGSGFLDADEHPSIGPSWR